MVRSADPFRPVLPVADAGFGQRAARPPAARAGVGAVAVVALVVHVPAGPHGGAGAPAEVALRTCALGRHSWLPTHRRPFALADSTSLSRPPERMWTDAAYPRPPPQGGPESMTPHETGLTVTPVTHAQRCRSRARSAPRGRPWEISATPTSRTIRSGSSGPRAPPVAGPPISPPSSAGPRGPPR